MRGGAGICTLVFGAVGSMVGGVAIGGQGGLEPPHFCERGCRYLHTCVWCSSAVGSVVGGVAIGGQGGLEPPHFCERGCRYLHTCVWCSRVCGRGRSNRRTRGAGAPTLL